MEERNYRFGAFKDGLHEIDKLNAAVKTRNGTAAVGIDKYSDLLPLERNRGTVAL